MSGGSSARSRAEAPDGKRVVAPEVLQDSHQVRLAAAEEAADPRRRLLGLAEVAEELIEDPFEPALVLALADEAAELPLQGRPVARVLGVLDLGHPEVRDVALGGVVFEDLSIR